MPHADAYGERPPRRPAPRSPAYGSAPNRRARLQAIKRYLAPVSGYFDRQGMLAREGLAQADLGAQQVRGGNLLEGGANMLLGPLGYLSSPATALLPTESEVYNAPDLPEDAKPLIAGGLGLAAMMLPGNKKGMGRPSSKAYHGSPTLRSLADFDMNAPRRTDYGYLGDGMYVAPEEWIARGYAGHKGYVHPLEMPQGKFKDFPYVDETYQKSVNEFARSIGVKADEGTREWAREFSEKMQAQGYVGARGVNNDGSMAEAVIFDPKSAISAPEGITAYHGSPHTFDRFDMSKIGTGEGAQAYGHGLYFAEREGTAREYRDALAPTTFGGKRLDEVQPRGDFLQDQILAVMKEMGPRADLINATDALANRFAEKGIRVNWPDLLDARKALSKEIDRTPAAGSMYQVRLNVKPDELLDWDRPLSEQPGIHAAIKEQGVPGHLTGAEAYPALGAKATDPAQAAKVSQWLRNKGIKGIRYKDAGSRGAEGGTYNYVIFDSSLIDILKRYGVAITAGAGGAAIVSGQDMPPEVAAQLGPQS